MRGDAVDEIARLKHQPGKDLLVCGSISVAQALIEKGLVDEYRLVLCPLVLGRGRPLFRENARSIPMPLVQATPMDRGAVSLVYGCRPDRR